MKTDALFVRNAEKCSLEFHPTNSQFFVIGLGLNFDESLALRTHAARKFIIQHNDSLKNRHECLLSLSYLLEFSAVARPFFLYLDI